MEAILGQMSFQPACKCKTKEIEKCLQAQNQRSMADTVEAQALLTPTN